MKIRAGSCALPALAADIGRSGPEAQRTLAGGLEKMIDIIAGLIPKKSSSDARQAAAGAIATMVGSILLARAAGDKRRAQNKPHGAAASRSAAGRLGGRVRNHRFSSGH